VRAGLRDGRPGRYPQHSEVIRQAEQISNSRFRVRAVLLMP